MLSDDQLEAVLNRVHDWTKAADEKLNIMVAVQALVLATLLPKVEAWWSIAGGRTRAALFLSMAFLTVGISYAVLALFPRTTGHGPPLSVTYFGDIAAHEKGEYLKRVRSMDSEALWNDHARQIHHSATLATAKFRRVRYAVWYFASGVACLGALRVAHALIG